jgi:hypothetical protein
MEYIVITFLMTGGVYMDDVWKEIAGAVISAVGTILAAIGSTPFPYLSENLLTSLNLIGNVLQATGNALEADGQEGFSLEKLGSELQAVGNVEVVGSIVLPISSDASQRLNIMGNFTQAFGGLVAIAEEVEDDSGQNQSLTIIGNALQAAGNSMQAIGGIYDLQKGKGTGQSITVAGSWIQAVGSVISAQAQFQESMGESNSNNDTDDKENLADAKPLCQP